MSAMDGSPVGGPNSILRPMHLPYLSFVSEGDGILISGKSPSKPSDYNFLRRSLLKNGAMGRKRKKKKFISKDDLSEDYCFVCKDGGDIRVCDFKHCLKSYHPLCLKKDNSFLESDERWICDWHFCYNCHQNSIFKCFCCPYSSCRACVKSSELVRVKGTKGFCNNCLRLAKLIEENAVADSDGEAVDFADTDTYEFLFKDYWEIVKGKERLTTENLQAADDLLRRGEKFMNPSDLDENFEVDKEGESSNDNCSDEGTPKHTTLKINWMKTSKERTKSKRTYIGWASKELLEFLISLGKDTQQSVGQHDVFEIVKDYIQANNLLRHDKKKKKQVFCDARLHSLFRRKKVNFFKVYSLLEKHLAENDDSDDESLSYEEDDYSNSLKRQRVSKSPKQKKERENLFQPQKNRFAAIIEANLKLIYLKRSLIMELMKDLKTFEAKTVGCFVRRKCDPKDSYGHGPLKKLYQLNQITGVKKALEEYKLGDINTNIVLCVSNYFKEIQICVLSDDNFEEEECEDLRHLVKEGLMKRPSIDELKNKIRNIHEDMVKHSVKKELLKLERLIERANEKGWRRDLFDYIERKKLLNKPEEIMRLVKELPDVTAEIETEIIEGGNLNGSAKNLVSLNKAEFQDGIQSAKSMILTAAKEIILEAKTEALCLDGILRASSIKDAAISDLMDNKEKQEDTDPSSLLAHAGSDDVIIVDERSKDTARPKTDDLKPSLDVVVITTDDEEEDIGNKGPADDVQFITPAVGIRGLIEKIWNYQDPSGNVQGPFSISTLKYWMEEGFFDEDFRIWKASQSQNDAIPLGVALRFFKVPN